MPGEVPEESRFIHDEDAPPLGQGWIGDILKDEALPYMRAFDQAWRRLHADPEWRAWWLKNRDVLRSRPEVPGTRIWFEDRARRSSRLSPKGRLSFYEPLADVRGASDPVMHMQGLIMAVLDRLATARGVLQPPSLDDAPG